MPEPRENSITSLLERIGGISAIIAGATAAIFILGLIRLAIPIWLRYNVDFATTAYGVSLVPRVMAFGLGAI